MTDHVQPTPAPISPSAVADRTIWNFARRFLASTQARIGFGLLVLLLFLCLIGPGIVPQDPYDLTQVSFMDSRLAPGSVSSGGYRHWLGTDAQGRDMLSAIVYGLRLSVFVALTATTTAFAIGTVIGLLSGFYGGALDTVIMRIADTQISIPPLLSALVLMATAGPGVGNLILSIIVVYWAYFARLVRASALVERRKEYVDAAICLALPTRRILLRHLLVNCLTPVTVLFTILIARAVLLESTLSFLGIGVPVTQPSLGLLISNGFGEMMSGRYWIALFPGLVLVLFTFVVNLVGDRLRELFNPKLPD
ncbi:ABC transporter permease subunit [Pseudooceanicola sp. 216_PA32_1]|uniref:ABC transporter permease subunit n=1 Tax=Pseudooceanicola pacificus TaxID=2676438 RepID=A0A844W395_9RHOB|nr:ABC transporter permease [Pseudooceanicola pacificus]MWB78267.1 ABC transporter permease subunit [Pseudooceanicola pacificus]